MSKGSRNRTTDWKAYREGWERCFGKKKRYVTSDTLRRAVQDKLTPQDLEQLQDEMAVLTTPARQESQDP